MLDMVSRLALLTIVAISAALAGCASTGPRLIDSTPTSSLPTPVARGDGTVTGGMYRCSALAPVVAVPTTLVAGTVDVFRGPLPGLPGWIINTDGAYSITLPPGPYDLVGHWTGSNLAPPEAKVIVSSEKVTLQNLIYQGCK
jgi:hypothetical protein